MHCARFDEKGKPLERSLRPWPRAAGIDAIRKDRADPPGRTAQTRRQRSAVRLAAAPVVTGAPRGAVRQGVHEPAMVSVPAYGSEGGPTGRASNVDAATHAVLVYIFIDGWWTKPTFDAPLSPIRRDGTSTCDVTTGGDRCATLFAAYLAPAACDPPCRRMGATAR